jgi:hypothetical protein
MKLLAQQLRPADRVRVTLICDTTTAWYSGMLPACLAQIYHPSGALRVVCRVCVRVRLIDLISCEVVAELQIRLEPLAKWCGARFIHARAERIEFARNLVVCQRVADHQSGDLTDYPPRPPPTTADDAEAEAEGEELRCEDYVPSKAGLKDEGRRLGVWEVSKGTSSGFCRASFLVKLFLANENNVLVKCTFFERN